MIFKKLNISKKKTTNQTNKQILPISDTTKDNWHQRHWQLCHSFAQKVWQHAIPTRRTFFDEYSSFVNECVQHAEQSTKRLILVIVPINKSEHNNRL